MNGTKYLVPMDNDTCKDVALNVTLEDLNRTEVLKFLPVLIFYVVAMVFGVIGNIIVLYIYKYKFKRSSARVYILCLALTDLSVCLVGLPYHILDLVWVLVYDTVIACKLLSFLIGGCTLSSVFVLLVVGLDRYCKVCRPLKKQIVDFGDRKACIIAIIFAFIISVPNAIFYGRRSETTSEQCITGFACFIADEFINEDFSIAYFGLYVLLFVLSVVFLIVIYGLILRKIYRHDKTQGNIVLNKERGVLCSCFGGAEADNEEEEIDYDEDYSDEFATCGKSDDLDKDALDDIDKERDSLMAGGGTDKQSTKRQVSKDDVNTKAVNKSTKTAPKMVPLHAVPSSAMIRHGKKTEKNTRKITLMMMTITIVFIASYLPFIAISLIHAISDDTNSDKEHVEQIGSDFLLRFYLINNVANPIIYSFWDKKFRKECKVLLRSMFFCCNDENHDPCNGTTGYATRHTEISMKTIG